MYSSNLFLLRLHVLLFVDNGSISSHDHHNEDRDMSMHDDSEINYESVSDNGMYILAHTWKE